MPYSTQRGTDGADRYRVRQVDARLATIEDDLDSGVIGGGGGGGAPTGAAYVTIGSNATLTGERALTQGSGIAITDGGANSTVTIAASGVSTAELGGDITTAGKALLDDADAAAQRTTLGLGTLATQSGTFSGSSSGTNTGDQTITLTGDVTGSGTGTFAATIAANAVTNADLADVPTATLKGRTTAGTGDPEDLTATQATALLNTFSSTTKGLVPASGGGTTNFLRADGTFAAPPGGGGGPTLAKSILGSTQGNSTLTPVVLTGCTFTLTPGQSLTLDAILIFTAAATTTGGALGIRVAQAAGASANAIGAAHGYVNLSNAAAATGLADGDNFVVTANTNVLFEVLGTATTAGDNAAHIKAVVHNLAAAHNTTVTVEFRSEVNGSLVTAQIGSGAIALIG